VDATTEVERAKFVASEGPQVLSVGDVPWAYGDDRITVIVRDPDSAYLYWEIREDGIVAARSRLGPAGAHGWCNLRVYDTTGRDFDGTNANDYFDIRVDRADREYYLMIRRPGSSMHAEIGIKTHEGFFQPIARSGRGDFPRDSPSLDTRLEWMTVKSDSLPPCAAPCRSRYEGREPPLPGREGAGYVDIWRAAYAPSNGPVPPERGPWAGSTSLVERRASAHVERWWLLEDWRAALRFLRGEHFDPRRIGMELLGIEPERIEREGGEMIMFGPWRLQIQGFETAAGGRVLSTWSVHWVRATTPLIERWERLVARRQVSFWEREVSALGASEARVLRERGASELLWLGGSERMWMGASEWWAGGASETRWLGASRLLRLGASETIGASERLGASEWMRMGASEWAGDSARVGASEGAAHAEAARDVHAEKWAIRPEGA
jgi:hypothetical protein